MLLSRDYVKIGEAAKILGVTEQTLRNWHNRGKLVPVRHPINGYRMYRVADVHAILQELGPFRGDLPFDVVGSIPSKAEATGDALPPCRRAKSDFDTFVPPYRWRITEGTLPDGIWRACRH
jgi:hypothetical protein